MNISILICRRCDTANAVTECKSCSRAFVITNAHLHHLPREFERDAVDQVPEGFQIPLCDFCTTKSERKLAQAVSAGLR